MSPEAPGSFRRARWLLALVVAGAGCGEGSRAPGAAASPGESEQVSAGAEDDGDPIEEVRGVALSELTDTERELWVALANAELSPCGEPVSVARCANEGTGCPACAGAARYLVRLVMEGYDRATIEERYEGRYGPEGGVELAVAAAPSRGPADAAVTVVEFSDFECPHCGRAHGVLRELLETHRDDVRLVFKHCPLLQHPRAEPAARAAEAARNQGKFWEMHDVLFEHQRALEDADLEGYARELGLDLDRFRADLASPEVQARVDADRDEAVRVGVQGTPTMFVNGRRFEESLETLEAYVKEALVR